MAIKTISLSRLEAELTKTLTDCAERGDVLVVELPDERLLTIQSLDSPENEDALVDELLANNPRFRALVAKSKASPIKPFSASSDS